MSFPTWKTKIGCPKNNYLFLSKSTVVGVGITTDEKDETTEWVFHMIDTNRFYILNAVGANDGQRFLSVAEDGESCFLTEKNCGVYRSEWTLAELAPDGGYKFQTYRDKHVGYRTLGVNSSTGYVKIFQGHQPTNIWRYFYLKVAVVDVSFKLSDAVLGKSTPTSLVRQVLPNNTSHEQSMTLIVAEKYEETSMFENTVGVSASVGTTFSTGLPFVAEGEVSLELTASFDATWGKSQTFSRETNATFPIIAPPNTNVVCDVVMTKTKLSVPFILTLADGRHETGTWTGLSGWDIKAHYKEEEKKEENFE